MSWFKSNISNLQWEELLSVDDLENAIMSSHKLPVLIFKHSTRCSISSMAKSRLERSWKENLNIKTFYLDLLSNRDISDQITNEFKVDHQSPQILIIKDGKCIYNASHNEIDFQKIKLNTSL